MLASLEIANSSRIFAHYAKRERRLDVVESDLRWFIRRNRADGYGIRLKASDGSRSMDASMLL